MSVSVLCNLFTEMQSGGGVGEEVAVLSLMSGRRFCITNDNVDGSLPI